ncbi:hypothetical protein [Phocaeicola sartorii]|uniref:hypothetical protein n=1 Tax=Phocaeicola sartorii TaxID=671267 RepID=UPI00242D5A0A|nr:hypothetical protein [Phocaeicola sartorii]
MHAFIRMKEEIRMYQQAQPPAPERQPESIEHPERTKKGGGSSPFPHIKKGAATTLRNALFIAVSVETVVAVAALLQNSGKEKRNKVFPVGISS